MWSLEFSAPGVALRILGERLKKLRLAEGWTRDELSERAGVAPSTLKRFETTGQISLKRLFQLASALGALEPFEALLLPARPTTLADLEAAEVSRKRGRSRRRNGPP